MSVLVPQIEYMADGVQSEVKQTFFTVDQTACKNECLLIALNTDLQENYAVSGNYTVLRSFQHRLNGELCSPMELCCPMSCCNVHRCLKIGKVSKVNLIYRKAFTDQSAVQRVEEFMTIPVDLF